jgi:hypothetical protein
MVWTKFFTTCYGILVNSGCNTIVKIFLLPQFAKKQRPTMIELLRMIRKSCGSG